MNTELDIWCKRTKVQYRIIAAIALGRPLKFFGPGHGDNEVVHHINGDHDDDSKGNHLICTSSYHMWIHANNRSKEYRKKLSVAQTGKTCSEEARSKMQGPRPCVQGKNHFNCSGKNNPNYGVKASEEKKAKMSKNHADVSGKNHPNYGIRASEEKKAKMRAGQKRYRDAQKLMKCWINNL